MHRPDGKTSRRVLLETGRQAGISFAAGPAGPLAPLLAAPGSRWFKIGAASVEPGKADPSSFDAVKKIGLDGVQVQHGERGRRHALAKARSAASLFGGGQATGLEIGRWR